MLKLLNEQQRRTNAIGGDDPIFPGGGRHGRLARGSINAFIKGALRWDVHVDPHGFRATLKAWARAQRPPYHELFVERQFDHTVRGVTFDAQGVAGYDDHNRPGMTDPTIEGRRARREMMENYGTYLESYKTPSNADAATLAQQPAQQGSVP